jgi:hypothetical protein
VRIEVIEKLLNHVSGCFSGVTGIYQRHSYMDEMRVAVALWEKHVASLLKPSERPIGHTNDRTDLQLVRSL